MTNSEVGLLERANPPAAPGSPHDGDRQGLEPLRSLIPFFAAVHDPVAVIDAGGVIRFANAGLRLLMGTDLPFFWLSTGGEPNWLRPADHGRWRGFFDAVMHDEPGEQVASLCVCLLDGRGRHVPVTISASRVGDVGAADAVLFALVQPVRAAGAVDSATDRAAADGDLAVSVRDLVAAVSRVRARVTGDDAPPGAGSDGYLPDSLEGRLESLSRREREIVDGLTAGWRVSTIASALFLSENTVRNHLKKVYRKIGVHSCAELRELLTPRLN